MTDILAGAGVQWLEAFSDALVYIAILAAFAVGLVKCVMPVINAKSRIRRASKLVRQGDRGKRSWQEDDFLGRGALFPHWKEYLNNLFFADGVFHNPSNVEDFINEDTVIYGPGRAGLSDALPGVMVSLGFLGTLLGITRGLRGFSMDDAEQVMAAIRQLVPGMRYAFMTSIAGVVASIAFTIINKAAVGGAKNALTDFYGAMNLNAGVVSVDPMTQIAIYQQEQTALIQRMADEITGDLPSRLAQGMTSAMNETIKSLKSNVDEFMMHTTEQQLKGIDQMAGLFLDRLNGLMNDEFQRLGKNLSDINRVLLEQGMMAKESSEAVRRMNASLISSSNAAVSISSKLEDGVGRLSATCKATQEGFDRLAANAEHLDIVAGQFNTFIMSVNKMQSESIAAVERFDENSERFMGNLYASMQEASASLKAASASIRQSSDTLASSHKMLAGGITTDIDKTYNALFKSAFDAIDRVDWTLKEVKDTLERLPVVLQSANDMYLRQSRAVEDQIRKLNESAGA